MSKTLKLLNQLNQSVNEDDARDAAQKSEIEQLKKKLEEMKQKNEELAAKLIPLEEQMARMNIGESGRMFVSNKQYYLVDIEIINKGENLPPLAHNTPAEKEVGEILCHLKTAYHPAVLPFFINVIREIAHGNKSLNRTFDSANMKAFKDHFTRDGYQVSINLLKAQEKKDEKSKASKNVKVLDSNLYSKHADHVEQPNDDDELMIKRFLSSMRCMECLKETDMWRRRGIAFMNRIGQRRSKYGYKLHDD